jgi:hypothetical protein
VLHVYITIATLDEEECGNLISVIILGTSSCRQDVHVRKWVTVEYTILRYCRIHTTDNMKFIFLSL